MVKAHSMAMEGLLITKRNSAHPGIFLLGQTNKFHLTFLDFGGLATFSQLAT